MNIKAAVLIAVAVLAVVIGGIVYVVVAGDDDDERRAAALVSERSYTAGNVAVELDGVNVGFVKSVAGCDVNFPTVLISTVDGTQKQPGAPKFTPCTIRFGSGMKSALYQWISDSLAGKASARNVSIVGFDANYKAVTRLNLTGAAITRFATPALNGASDAVAIFDLTLEPGSVKRAAPSGSAPLLSTKAKQMISSNFKLTAVGLEADLQRVTAVDSWAFEIEPAPVGETRLATAGRPKFEDLAVTVTAPGGAEFDTWLDAALQGSPTKKTISLSLLDPTQTQSLVDVTFSGAGLTTADLLGRSESSTSVSKRTFSMYVDGASVKFNTGVFG